MGLRWFILRRGLFSLLILFGVIVLNFLIFRIIPGRPLYCSYGHIPGWIDGGPPNELVANFELWGVGQPLHIEFIIYVRNLLTFNFGNSATEGFRPIIGKIYGRLYDTLLLVGLALVLLIVSSVGSSAIFAARRGGNFDTGMVVSAFTFKSIPIPFLGAALFMLFAFYLPIPGFLPSTVSPPVDPILYVIYRGKLAVLPSITLALFCLGNFILILRSNTLFEMNKEVIELARFEGMDEETILAKYAMPDPRPSLSTQITLFLGGLIGGVILAETVFGWYGLGNLFYLSLVLQDFGVVHALFYLFALPLIMIYLLASLLEAGLKFRAQQEGVNS
ncbi:MAG: ABC transporter permease [Promethearchaeota archaeon]